MQIPHGKILILIRIWEQKWIHSR